MIDAGESEENIATVIQHYKSQSAPPSAPSPENSPFGFAGLKNAVGGLTRGTLRLAREHPAETGALVGGALAAPLTGGASIPAAMMAAGLGGAGGAGLGMIGGAAAGSPHVPTTPTGVLGEMAAQGAMQAGGEGAGQVAGRLLKAGASRLYQSVLKPTLAARREFPNLVATGLEHGIPVSSHGAEQAGELVGQSKAAADQLVADAAARPGAATVDPRQAVGGITEAVKQVKDLPVARPQMKAIGDYGRQYLAEHPRQLSLTEAQKAVRATDRFYDPAYRATMDRGNAITSGQTAAAVGINDATRGILRRSVPGLQEQNAVTSGLHGLQSAVERRAGEQGNRSAVGMQHLINAGIGAGTGLVGGKEKGLGTFAAMEAFTNPAIASRLAIGGARASALPFAQMARMVRAAILARLANQTQSETAQP